MKHMKMKWPDLLLILVLVLMSFIPNALFAVQAMSEPQAPQEKVLIIKVNAVETERIKLAAGKAAYDHPVKLPDGQSNILTIDGEAVTMREANCPDKYCIKVYGTIKAHGEQIICLPHKLVVEIQGGEAKEGDMNAY